MTRWLTRIRGLLLLAIIGLLALAAVLISRYVTDYPAAQAVLIVSSGSIHVTRAVGEPFSVQASASEARISQGDTLDADGLATVHYANGAETDLFPGTKLRIDRLGVQGDQVQLALSLLDGQLINRVNRQTDRRAFNMLTLKDGVTVATQTSTTSVEFLALYSTAHTFIGALSGTPTLRTSNGFTLNISMGSGVAIANDQPIPPPTPWTAVPWVTIRVPTYHADGSALALPVTLSTASDEHFLFMSDRAWIAPGGVYTLSVATFQPYTLPGVTLTPGTSAVFPVTFGEVQLSITDSTGKLLPTPPLTITDANKNNVTVAPDVPLLVSPGTLAFNVTRSDSPDLPQSTGAFEVLPGQRLVFALRSDLFGAGTLQVNVTGIDGTPQTTASIMVFVDGNDDNGTPLLTAKSDGSGLQLPLGKYVATIVAGPRGVAGRYPFEIKTGQTTLLNVTFGTLSLSVTDSVGHVLSRLVYIASATEMARLNLSIDQMRQTIYGIALYTGQSVTVPSGNYVISLTDPHAALQRITVAPGKNTPIAISTATAMGTPGAP